MTLVDIKRLFCERCDKYRVHEVLHGLARCMAPACGWQRVDGEHESVGYSNVLSATIERFSK